MTCRIRLLIAIPLISIFLVSAFGCAPLLIGGAVGALGGYAVSKDTIQDNTDVGYEWLWKAAQAIAKIRGKIKAEDKSKGYLELEADSSRVIVRVIRLTRQTCRLKVSSRKMGLPNITLAQEIFIKILEQASE